jgi:predicted nucleic acid-binding protein
MCTISYINTKTVSYSTVLAPRYSFSCFDMLAVLTETGKSMLQG